VQTRDHSEKPTDFLTFLRALRAWPRTPARRLHNVVRPDGCFLAAGELPRWRADIYSGIPAAWEVNLTAPFLLIKAALPAMTAQRYGRTSRGPEPVLPS
jgi:hypothetical protein